MDLSHVSRAIDILAKPIKIRRYSETYDVGLYDDNGRWNDPNPATEDTIRGAIFTTTPNEVRDLSEGVRTEARWTLWTRSEIFSANDAIGKPSDEIEWGGSWFKILLIQPRREGGFTKAFLGVMDDRGRTV